MHLTHNRSEFYTIPHRIAPSITHQYLITQPITITYTHKPFAKISAS